MRYRILGLAAVAVMLLAAAAAASLEPEAQERGRVHQHLAYRGDEGCGCGGSALCSHLPLIVIDTGGQRIPGALAEGMDRFGQAVYTTSEDGLPVITAQVAVIDNAGANNHLTDPPALEAAADFRIRGNSSRRFPKLPYLLDLKDGEGNNLDYPMMGMDAHHEWALHGPILDKSLIRNYMWYNISGEIMEYAPNVRFCELVLNGRHQGLYLMVETITNGDDCRLPLRLDTKNAEATGYLLRVDRPTETELESIRDVYTFAERDGQIAQDIAIRYPGRGRLTEALKKSIELDVSAFEKAIFSYDYNTGQYGYWNWVDVDSFVDYFLINEFTKNSDAGGYSTYLYKEVGGKFKLCVWDFNNVCDNFREEVQEPENFLMIKRSWFFMMLKDEAFVEKLLARYGELRRGVLSEAYLMNYIDETLDWLGPAIDRNNDRWGDEMENWEGLMPPERNIRSHREGVEQLREWLCQRGGWLDENIHALRQYAHPSRNKKFSH